jgi:hypothetical protein
VPREHFVLAVGFPAQNVLRESQHMLIRARPAGRKKTQA